MEYRINGDGLRDESYHSAQRLSDVTRVLLLGDSFTYGKGVSYEHIWPVIFESKLLENDYRVDVVKAGVPGYDTWQEVLYLEQIFLKYKPDIVILAFLPNDLILNAPIGQADPKDLERVTGRSPFFGLIAKNSKLHSVHLGKRMLMSSDYWYAKLYLLTPWSEHFKLPMSDWSRRKIEITKGLFDRAKRYCEQQGATFVVLSIPQRFQVVVRAHQYDIGGIDVDIDKLFSDFASKQQIEWIPTLDALSESYRDQGEDLYLSQDGHLNEEGHLVVGNYLFTEFTAKVLDKAALAGSAP